MVRETKRFMNKSVKAPRLVSRKCAPLLKNSRRLNTLNIETEMSAVLDNKPKKPKTPEHVVEGLGAKLRRAREDAGLSVRQLATRSGISGGRISQLENDKGNLRLPHFMDVVRALGIRAGDLLDPEIDDRSQIVQLARRIKKTIGNEDLEWLGQLDRIEARIAMEYAHAGVDLHLRKLEEKIRESVDAPVLAIRKTEG
jgi:transcriptional regulator with XRE-family HTH domain